MADFKVKNNLVVEGASATLPANTTVGGSTAISESSTSTLTNKTIDADSNTITNIENADIKAGAAIALTKLAATTASRALVSNGSGFITTSTVTSAELGTLSGVTGAIQTQLDGKATTSLNNIASTAIPVDLLPDADDTYNLGSDTLRFSKAFVKEIRNSANTLVMDFSGTDVSLNTRKLTNVTDPSNPQDAATKAYVDSLSSGLRWKAPVRVATTTAGTLATSFENGDTVDGVTLATGDRILIKDQATQSENGIYTVNASGAPTRATDMDSGSEADAAAVFVTSGTVNADKGFVQTTDSTTIGTSNLVFTQFSNVLYTADGQGIELSGGNQFSLELDGSTLSKSASGLKVADGGITNTQVNASAAIAYSKLDLAGSIVNADINASAAIAYSKLNLSGSIVNADVNASAAIAYSKLNLSASIVDADVATGAAIARTKLASGSANHVLINDGSGVMSSEAVLAVSRGGTNSSTTLNNNRIMVSSSGSIVEAAALTNGQLLIGSTGAAPVAATITAGTGISVTNGAGSITISTAASGNDIPDTQFNFTNNQASAANVTGLAFANASVRSFQALVSVFRDGTANLYEVFTLNGVQKDSSWDMTVTSTGDDSGVVFTITTAGQVQYTSTNNAGSSAEKMRFRAITTAIET